jgi:hypothetical protein
MTARASAENALTARWRSSYIAIHSDPCDPIHIRIER